MTLSSVSLFILNYNGETLLPECLPGILKAAQGSRRQVRVVVIDNHSRDASPAVMAKSFAGVPFIRARANRFLSSFNEFVEADTSDAVILMNNDIKTEPGFIDPLIDVLERRDDAFFTSPLCWDFDKVRYEGGLSMLSSKAGWWGTRSILPAKLRPDGGGFWLTASMGACLALRRDRFLELGGYDDLYLPGILEDLDLCYRGWKRGWKGYFVPESVVYHKGQASFAPAFGKSGISRMAARNTCYFMWKNIRDPLCRIQSLFWLPVRAAAALLGGNTAFLLGLKDAFGGRAKVRERRPDPRLEVLSDREILKIFQCQAEQIRRLK